MPRKKKKELTIEEKFPHDGFPFRLQYLDRGDNRTCWFSHELYLNKHVERYGIQDATIEAAPGFSLTPPKVKKTRTTKKQPSRSKASQASKTKKSSKPAAKVAKPKAAPKKTKKPKMSSLETFFDGDK